MAAAARSVNAGLSMVGTGEGSIVSVCESVIVLGPGPERARKRFAVDENFLIAFAPPDEHGIGELIHGADDLAFARRI